VQDFAFYSGRGCLFPHKEPWRLSSVVSLEKLNHAELIEWGPIEKVGDIASDIQQAAFWTQVSRDVE
jgi:hypothetical protein